jgi:hypothetical protein
MKRHALLAAAIVVVSCAIGVVAGTRNQSGDQTGFMSLKVGLQARVQTDEENSGASITLRVATDTLTVSEVFTAARMAELGFKPGGARREAARQVFIVLQREDNSPLRIADAGLDGKVLQGRYPDRSRYLVTQAVIMKLAGREVGRVNMILPGMLYVPSGTTVGDEVRVRSGRNQIPYVVPTGR